MTAGVTPSNKNADVRMEELLIRVAEHDTEALGSLYDHFAPRLMGLLIRILSSKAEAETALQEVFLRLWKEATGIVQAKGSVAAWLVLMTRQEGFQRLRARRAGAARASPDRAASDQAKPPRHAAKPGQSTRREHKPRERPGGKSASPTWSFLAACPRLWTPLAEEVASAEARLGLLQRAFDQMPKPQRRALELAVFDAYTESEIAAELGEPLAKVNAGLRAAFTFLRHRQQAVLGTWTADL